MAPPPATPRAPFPILALIGMGSNLGDRQALLDGALIALAETPGIVTRGVSSYHETIPVGGPTGQGPFLNAAAALETTLPPDDLLAVLNQIEARAGRSRTVRWGERTLDLDLLLYGDLVLETPRLQVPHPRLALRRFVLAPLAEIAPTAIEPVTGRTVADLLANLDRRPSYVALASPRMNWHRPPNDATVALVRRTRPEVDLSSLFQSEGRPLLEALCRELPAIQVESLIQALLSDESAAGSFERTHEAIAQLAIPPWISRPLDPTNAARLTSPDGWLVSHCWVDALFLQIDSLKCRRPHYRAFFERFLEARAKMHHPTFVVARPQDKLRLGIQNPNHAWQRPVGWDAPLLLVDDFESAAAITDVLSACRSTRSS